MNLAPLLEAALRPVAERQRRLRFWSAAASCWAAIAFLGLLLVAIQRSSGFGSFLALPFVALVGLAAFAVVLIRINRREPDWRQLTRLIEAQHPGLDGLLLTAAQQGDDSRTGL